MDNSRPTDSGVAVRTYSVHSRPSKVHIADFATVGAPGASFRSFLDSLPRILAANDFRSVVEAIVAAYRHDKPVIIGMGAHVIKCGLSPLIIELARRGVLKGLALNGAGVIHDFEIAFAGKTSEAVEDQLDSGQFGMAEETASILNQAIREGAAASLGLGEAVARKMMRLDLPYRELSVLIKCYEYQVPVTVHVAIGTDIIHMHPAADGAAIGQASMRDFRTFASLVAALEGGGVYLNIGSAVVLPEVFLKAVSLVRNSGRELKHFTTVNMDFIQHYRPRENVVRRPTKQGGRGYSLTGHHELMLPLLVQAVLEEIG